MNRDKEDVICVSGMYASESEKAAGALGMRERIAQRHQREQVNEMRAAAGMIRETATREQPKGRKTKAEIQREIAEMREQANKGV